MIAEVNLILLIILLFVLIAVVYYLFSIHSLIKNRDAAPTPSTTLVNKKLADQRLPALTSPDELFADIIISPVSVEESTKGDNLSADLYPKIEAIFRSVPALASAVASSRKLYKITFSPKVAKGLSDGSYSLMQSEKGLKAIAVDNAGKIVEQGKLSIDRVAGAVSAVGAVWQVMAILTAQKFLSDINSRLAGIEDSLKGLETWLDTQEQGRFLGSYKYLSEVAATSASSPNATDFLIIKGQAERIYHESLQSIESNKLRMDSTNAELLRNNFEGNLIPNTEKFRKLMDSYFLAASYAIKFSIVAALSEYLSAYIDRSPEQESKRIDAIIKDSEAFVEKIRQDSKKMKDKASQISGRWWNAEDTINEKRNSLSVDMETLLSSCEDALIRIRSISDETKKIGAYTKELENKGLSLMIETDSSGKLISAKSLQNETRRLNPK